MRFLIIDDDRPLSILYRRSFTRMFGRVKNFEVRVAHTIEMGLAELTIYKANTVLLDLNLPPYHPEHVIAKIHEFAANADVIVSTGHVEESIIESAFASGANDFIPKSLLFDSSAQDGRLGIERLESRFCASYYRSLRDHGN